MSTENVMLEFHRRRRRRTVAVVVALVLLFFGVSMLAQMVGDRPAQVSAILILVGLLAFIWKDWRCPACEKSLGPEFQYKHCPHCGERLAP